MKSLIYNRLSNEFEELTNQEFYLVAKKDFKRSDEAEVITLVDTKYKLGHPYRELPLNSYSDEDTFKAVELFKKQDRSFCKYVTFFSEDNPQSMIEILK